MTGDAHPTRPDPLHTAVLRWLATNSDMPVRYDADGQTWTTTTGHADGHVLVQAGADGLTITAVHGCTTVAGPYRVRNNIADMAGGLLTYHLIADAIAEAMHVINQAQNAVLHGHRVRGFGR